MAGRTNRLGSSKGGTKARVKLSTVGLDYHEGLSWNQVKIILHECGFGNRIGEFGGWLYGQTGLLIHRSDKQGRLQQVCGTFEEDLFRWIENKKKGTPLVWD